MDKYGILVLPRVYLPNLNNPKTFQESKAKRFVQHILHVLDLKTKWRFATYMRIHLSGSKTMDVLSLTAVARRSVCSIRCTGRTDCRFRALPRPPNMKQTLLMLAQFWKRRNPSVMWFSPGELVHFGRGKSGTCIIMPNLRYCRLLDFFLICYGLMSRIVGRPVMIISKLRWQNLDL